MTAPQSLPRGVITHRVLAQDEPMYITCLSDLHLESSLCDVKGLRKLLEERAKLPNHSVVLIGDVMDLVGNRDLQRYMRSGQNHILERYSQLLWQ